MHLAWMVMTSGQAQGGRGGRAIVHRTLHLRISAPWPGPWFL
jgi:hypothetical protein